MIQLGLACLACAWVSPASAQRADVPKADQARNFRSSRVQGNRGFYPQIYWLVVDQDPKGLNCRGFPSSKPLIVFQYGDIIKADHNGPDEDAISIRNGQTWLRVISKQRWRLSDSSARGHWETTRCIVRANSALVAPINVDDLSNILHSE